MIPHAELADVAAIKPDPSRDAIGLALVMAESTDDAAAVADSILENYELTGPVLSLICHLAQLVSIERDDADEFLYELALDKARG